MTKTIEWLVRKVNELLDTGCGCNCEGSSTGSLPMFVKWGNPSETEAINNIQTTQDFTIISQAPTLAEFNGNYDLLKITFPTEIWNEIQTKQPTILLDRYRGKSVLGSSGGTRKAGYRHEPELQAQANGRRSEVLVTENGGYLDFKMDEYFILDDLNRVRAKGFSRDRSTTRNSPGGLMSPAGFFNFALRLRLTDGTNVVETDYLGYFKAVLHYVSSDTLIPAKITYRPI